MVHAMKQPLSPAQTLTKAKDFFAEQLRALACNARSHFCPRKSLR